MVRLWLVVKQNGGPILGQLTGHFTTNHKRTILARVKKKHTEDYNQADTNLCYAANNFCAVGCDMSQQTARKR